MASLDLAQLSALAASADDLAARSASLAESLEGPDSEEASMALYEAERSLRMAIRAVGRAQRSLGA